MYQTESTRHRLMHRVNNRLFNTLYNRSLIYNTCWEDPDLDREALQLDDQDEVLMITSAGCNALDYALDAPRRIDTVDANPRQTALLELKIAGIRSLPYDDFFTLFGQGRHRHIRELYRDHLRPWLSPSSRRFWDSRWTWFRHHHSRRSFYYRGLCGTLARAVTTWMRLRSQLWPHLDALSSCASIEEQRAIYDRHLASRLIGPVLGWSLKRPLTMSLLGVPYPQRQAVQASHADGIAGFIRSCLDAVLRELPFAENYFWQVYLRGGYSSRCHPRYLSEVGFHRLKYGLVDRVHAHTCTLTDFLRSHPDRHPSRFILLDHMDWMGHAFPQALSEEWEWICRQARPGSRVLFRSAEHHPGFLEHCYVSHGRERVPLRELLDFHPAWADELHRRDRVHTYASFHIGDLRVGA